jgi:hypothetical protein
MFDFPGIYEEADSLSNKTQKRYLRVLKLFLGLLLVSSILFSYFANIWEVKLFNAIVSLGIVVLSFIFSFVNFQGIWYNARAVAESIKTTSWRYALKAEPYDISDVEAKLLLIETIKKILKMNHDFVKNISADYSNHDQIPINMTAIRSLNTSERLEFYYVNRIIEQRDWYQKKSDTNKKSSFRFFVLLITISLLLSIGLFLDLEKSNTIVYPIPILLSALSIIFTWVQTKKYRELEKSYALASHEIGFIAMLKDRVCTDKELSNFVIDSENAFSREHTQWIARKDN